MTSELALEFARKIRAREQAVGYWAVLDAPVATERIGRLGYDYVALDAQHGLLGYSGVLSGLMAIDAGHTAVGMVRVEDNNLTAIGKALDAGAVGVIVPLVNTAADAAAAVAAAKYPPMGGRSYGPMRSALRIGPVPADANAATLVFAMIETPDGLKNVKEICATPGLDGIYVGPSDLAIAVGGAYPGDPAIDAEFNAALETIAEAAASAGVAAGIHTASGDIAAQRLRQGYTFTTVASDLTHLELAAKAHLAAATAKD
ncbi:5-keto-4-deoxy-D-glucarate aldolase [Arthrobacter sp. Bi83]|uniref:HpcH/HpaI aldolase family protein n=1 Tax=Arthrobacter sp. Bi83 TaxID=2822353 RepID=UPI001DA4A006|nr:aldolase/citrate lyase family protein [Arthrobacter sp. Bi83]CAH0170804.1 5-keto-4-deoxy-D-glucarate aldolase [Arthrobacter sp. Bi83]